VQILSVLIPDQNISEIVISDPYYRKAKLRNFLEFEIIVFFTEYIEHHNEKRKNKRKEEPQCCRLRKEKEFDVHIHKKKY
jgi:hypothetical protein